ncbi:MAG: HAD hydrolase-like protein [Planctomycetota bacterium]
MTAEDVRAYKPAPAHFQTAGRHFGLPPERVLHVACSSYHDLRPARAQGWRTAWITRGTAREAAAAEAGAVFPNLAGLAAALLAEGEAPEATSAPAS